LRCLGQTRGFLHSVSCVTPDKLAVSPLITRCARINSNPT
jgi:hypothetical protein